MTRILQTGIIKRQDGGLFDSLTHLLRFFPPEPRRYTFCRVEFSRDMRVGYPESDGSDVLELDRVTCTSCLRRWADDSSSHPKAQSANHQESTMAKTKTPAAAPAAPAPAETAQAETATTAKYRLSQFKLDRAALAKKLDHLPKAAQKAVKPLLERNPAVYTLEEIVQLSALVYTSKDAELVAKKDSMENRLKVLAWHAENNQRKQAEVLSTVEGVLEGKVTLAPAGAPAPKAPVKAAAKKAAPAKKAAKPKAATPAPEGTQTSTEQVEAGEALNAIREPHVEDDNLFEIPEEEINVEEAENQADKTVELQSLEVGTKFWVPGTNLNGTLTAKNQGSAGVKLNRGVGKKNEDTYISLGTMVVPGVRPPKSK